VSRDDVKTDDLVAEALGQAPSPAWLIGLKAVANDVYGRALLWELMGRGQPFLTSFRPNDPTLTAFLEGQREQSLWLFRDLMAACPENYSLMAAEAAARAAAQKNTQPAESE